MGMFDWLDDFTGYKNPSDDARKYLDQIPGVNKNYLDPFWNAGKGMIPGMTDQYNNLTNDPNSVFNKMAAGYQQSPGYQFQKQQALQGAGHAAAAGGMAGSPMHEQMNATLSSNLANKDFNDYISKILGLYQLGSEGRMNMFKTGADAGNNAAKNISDSYTNSANNAFAGATDANQRHNDYLSLALSMIGL